MEFEIESRWMYWILVLFVYSGMSYIAYTLLRFKGGNLNKKKIAIMLSYLIVFSGMTWILLGLGLHFDHVKIDGDQMLICAPLSDEKIDLRKVQRVYLFKEKGNSSYIVILTNLNKKITSCGAKEEKLAIITGELNEIISQVSPASQP